MVLHCRIPDWTRTSYTTTSLNNCIKSSKYSILLTGGGLAFSPSHKSPFRLPRSLYSGRRYTRAVSNQYVRSIQY